MQPLPILCNSRKSCMFFTYFHLHLNLSNGWTALWLTLLKKIIPPISQQPIVTPRKLDSLGLINVCRFFFFLSFFSSWKSAIYDLVSLSRTLKKKFSSRGCSEMTFYNVRWAIENKYFVAAKKQNSEGNPMKMGRIISLHY